MILITAYILITYIASASSIHINSKQISTSRPTNPSSGKYDFDKWKLAFRSQLEEFDYEISHIEGVLPRQLKGTLFRNMPARFERGSQEESVSYGHCKAKHLSTLTRTLTLT